MADRMRRCPNCNAQIVGWLCASCGAGTTDGREGIEVQPGLRVTAGQPHAVQPVKETPADGYGLAEEWIVRESKRNADREVENFKAADLEEVRLQDLGER